MDSVIVTGGLGKVGQWLLDGLADSGYDVTGIDLEHPGFRAEHARERVSFRAADLTDLGRVSDIVHDVDPDAVVHFGAIPTMGRHADSEVFENNVMTTYNVFKSAGRVGADIVTASSESVYGMAFAEETFLPDYLPIDEEHPTRPEDEYAMSKLMGEELAQMVVRRYGVEAASLRPAWIQYPGSYACLGLQDNVAAGANGMWAYIDVRDVVDLVEAALETDLGGHEAFLASAENNYLGKPTAEAVEEYFGETPEECDLAGDQSVYTTVKARKLLGWQPSHTWESAADEEVEGPAFLDQ